MQSAAYSQQVFIAPTESLSVLASAKSHTIGSACRANRFITFWLDELQRHSELLKSAQRSRERARNVETVFAYKSASGAFKPAAVPSCSISRLKLFSASLRATSAMICREENNVPQVSKP